MLVFFVVLVIYLAMVAASIGFCLLVVWLHSMLNKDTREDEGNEDWRDWSGDEPPLGPPPKSGPDLHLTKFHEELDAVGKSIEKEKEESVLV
jgi:hypothetical protein